MHKSLGYVWPLMLFLSVVVGLAAGARAAEAEPATQPTSADVNILMTRQWSRDGKVPTGTIWRTFQTWQTDIARTEKGELVRVDPLTPRAVTTNRGEQRLYPNSALPRPGVDVHLYPAKSVHGSALPPPGWQASDFDDADWTRDPNPQLQLYGLILRLCLRGKFAVSDPAATGEMNLIVRFRGGAIVYLNGKEVARSHLPSGQLSDDALADDYPKEAYVDPEGYLIEQGIYRHGASSPETLMASRIQHGRVQWNGDWNWRAVSYDNAANGYFNNKDPQVVERYRSRTRTLQARIPPDALRKGLNVLAIEIRRAAAWEGMFTSPGYVEGKKTTLSVNSFESYWDRCELEDVKLTAKPGGAVTPNVSPPPGVRIWTHPAAADLDPSFYADPNEPITPIRLRGLKNGTYSGQVVVSSDPPITGLSATVTDLKSPQGGVIAASNIQLGYSQIIDGSAGDASGFTIFDPLETAAPAEVTASAWSMGRTFDPMQPIWLTVRIPRDAKRGLYTGTLTVSVAGQPPTDVPVHLEVVADWTLPDSAAFSTQVSLFESPDALAKRYKVAMWSDEHWALLEKVFEIMGQLGVKDVYIPLVAKTHLGNAASMVRWIPQDDGSLKLDTSIAERYLDLAIKHLGKVPRVCLFVSTRSQYDPPASRSNNEKDQPICSQYDPATNQVKDFFPPKWGSAESQTFWKPVIQRMRQILAARGLENSMMFGYGADGLGPAGDNADGMPNHFADLYAISPHTRWMVSTHLITRSWTAGKKLRGPDFLGSHSWMFGFLFEVHWMDDNDTAMWKPTYGWRDVTVPVELAASRSRSPTLWGEHVPNVTRCRVIPEAVLLSKKSSGDPSYQGFGTWGADFFNNEWAVFDSYKNVALSESTMRCLVGAGRDGPVPTCRTRMLQEGLQEAELRIFVQNALLNDATQARLGPDLTRRCKEVCDSRTRDFTYMSCFRYSDSTSLMPRLRVISDLSGWEEKMVKLARLADEIAKATGGK